MDSCGVGKRHILIVVTASDDKFKKFTLEKTIKRRERDRETQIERNRKRETETETQRERERARERRKRMTKKVVGEKNREIGAKLYMRDDGLVPEAIKRDKG